MIVSVVDLADELWEPSCHGTAAAPPWSIDSIRRRSSAASPSSVR